MSERTKLTDQNSIEQVLRELTLDEKLNLAGQFTALSTLAIEDMDIPSISLVDGVTGVNGGHTGKSGSIRPLLIADADQIIQTDLIQLRQTDGNGDRQLPDAFFISGIHIAVAAEIVGNLADRQIVVRAQILQSLIFHDSSPLRKCY